MIAAGEHGCGGGILRGEGTLDGEEQAILATLGRWMAREGEAAICGSRPWRSFAEDGVR
jgi:alpha-L-fucosidase